MSDRDKFNPEGNPNSEARDGKLTRKVLEKVLAMNGLSPSPEAKRALMENSADWLATKWDEGDTLAWKRRGAPYFPLFGVAGGRKNPLGRDYAWLFSRMTNDRVYEDEEYRKELLKMVKWGSPTWKEEQGNLTNPDWKPPKNDFSAK